jgi:hypothetical protein
MISGSYWINLQGKGSAKNVGGGIAEAWPCVNSCHIYARGTTGERGRLSHTSRATYGDQVTKSQGTPF